MPSLFTRPASPPPRSPVTAESPIVERREELWRFEEFELEEDVLDTYDTDETFSLPSLVDVLYFIFILIFVIFVETTKFIEIPLSAAVTVAEEGTATACPSDPTVFGPDAACCVGEASVGGGVEEDWGAERATQCYGLVFEVLVPVCVVA
ncbi:hypothetical protein AAF712_005264 [Marasmius tenuissimus]|uniref:Uncharacterized protein n=1 Tax=Marasmius tenuissimus TaxID=585030 RepID=A0ABR3A233_9AGAR